MRVGRTASTALRASGRASGPTMTAEIRYALWSRPPPGSDSSTYARIEPAYCVSLARSGTGKERLRPAGGWARLILTKGPPMDTMVFINLPVDDLERSKAF